MFPTTPTPGAGPNLEDRLRGLILSNANANLESSMTAASHGENDKPIETGLPQQAETTNSSHPAGRKRPNQAQRRQMNSQLSIPIEPRPSHGVQAGRGPGSYGTSPNTSWGPSNHNNRAQMHQNQRPQYQQYSPRHQGLGPGSPYSPRSPFPQASPHSPLPPYQISSSPQFQSRQGPGHHQQSAQSNSYNRPPPQNRNLYQSGAQNLNNRGRLPTNNHDDVLLQASHLGHLLQEIVPKVGIDTQEEATKESFRALVEDACREAITAYEHGKSGNENFNTLSIELQCFGSMRSGFATKASDMDLALLTPSSDPAPDTPQSVIPRVLEKKLLDLGYGARLLTRTRVPIIKLCERPTPKLLADLREERLKWESGFGNEEDEEAVDDAAEVTTASRQSSKHSESDSKSGTVKSDDSGKREVVKHEKSLLLKQKEHQSFGEYHNAAKRYLRTHEGRDLTSNSPPLSDAEVKILNEVCKSFIEGLASSELSARLQTYQSISPLFNPTFGMPVRSLQGIVTQAEGERLALSWNVRAILEPTELREKEYLQVLSSWEVLQNDTKAVLDPLHYNRQLYFASEKLKKIPSLQLNFLEQIQHEEPVFYQTRAQRIMEELTPKDPNANINLNPVIVSKYIMGIDKAQIREDLQKCVHAELTLQHIATRHRALQLAIDYEHALKSGVYNGTDQDDVRQYATLLRSLTSTSTESQRLSIDGDLLAKIRSLPDPTDTSANKARDKYRDHLEFPKTDIGIQCDINFSAQLAIHNTQLLRCYSVSDSRVRPMILFIKHWAKVRGINTPYRGSLSSYGYVLMVLHYLVNIASPFVCPNLQLVQKDPLQILSPAEIEARTTCKGRDVRFWRNEAEIKSLADRNLLNHNHESLGILLRGFFEYYAQNGQMTTVQCRGFDWGREVLSLRTHGGILTKQEKGWVGAKTVVETTTVAAPPTPSTPHPPTPTDTTAMNIKEEVHTPKTPKIVEETKEIRHRYLFAIEDPFELDHNVARTVTHNGIVSIRDEFRRAWRITRSIGKPYEGQDGGLLDPHVKEESNKAFHELLNLLHGPPPKVEVAQAAPATSPAISVEGPAET